MCLILCLCHSVLITVVLLDILTSSYMLPLVLLLLLKITLIIQDLFVVSCKCLLLLFCISVTTDLGFLTGLALEPTDHLGLHKHFNGINSSRC